MIVAHHSEGVYKRINHFNILLNILKVSRGSTVQGGVGAAFKADDSELEI